MTLSPHLTTNVLYVIFCAILEGGHDSKEDALACLDLMKLKVKEEVKKLQKKARLQAQHS